VATAPTEKGDTGMTVTRQTPSVGLGADQRQARRIALANLRDGMDRCPYCMRPMHRRQRLDLDDFPARILAMGAGITPIKRLSHRSCNRRAGARLGNALRKD
jgi:hypothetical protein